MDYGSVDREKILKDPQHSEKGLEIYKIQATYFVTMLDELHDDEPVNLDGGDAALILRVLPRPALGHLATIESSGKAPFSGQGLLCCPFRVNIRQHYPTDGVGATMCV
jgi:hypothetical protein